MRWTCQRHRFAFLVEFPVAGKLPAGSAVASGAPSGSSGAGFETLESDRPARHDSAFPRPWCRGTQGPVYEDAGPAADQRNLMW